jgi:hypothetical protein
MIWIIWREKKLNSEIIWKIWKKGKSNSVRYEQYGRKAS